MKVLVIHGSARKNGNSAFLASRLAEAIVGAETTHRYLYDLTFKGCKGCMACRKNRETCVIDDALTPVLQEMHEADIVIFASPNYNGGVTGEMKSFIDRCFSLLRTDHFEKRAAGVILNTTRLPLGKTAVVLFVQGQDEQGQNEYGKEEIFRLFSNKVRSMGFPYVEDLRCCRLNSSKDSQTRTDLLAVIDILGRELSQRYPGS